MLRLLKVIFVAQILLFGATFALADADSYDHTQHNIKFVVDKWELGVRQDWNSEKDHLSIGYKSPYGKVEARFVEDDERERRFTYSKKTPLVLGSKLNWKVDYKTFKNDDSHFVFKPEVIIGDSIGLWGKVQPEWNLHKHGESNDLTIDKAKVVVGYNMLINEKIVFGPFWEYKTSGEHGDWKRSDVFLGTNLKVKF
jgi:hypothetical protein